MNSGPAADNRAPPLPLDALEARRARIAGLPPLRAVAADLVPKKSLGQHFLFDLNLTDKIARTARRAGTPADAPLSGVTVIEVGPGPGGLTRSLLVAGANVIAVEKDRRAAVVLCPLIEAARGALQLAAADALTADWATLAPPGSVICSNLPYNVATPLLVGWLTTQAWPPWWTSATVMIQREVAERLAAPPDTENYGRLAVLAGWRTHTTLAFDVPPTAFVPPPKVTSTVVRLDPRTDAEAVSPRALSAVTAAAFGQRRKMLRSSLRALPGNPEPEALLEAAGGLSTTARAETLSIDDFLRLARAFAALNSRELPHPANR